MDTKLKSTSYFKGLVSWICMLLLFCFACTAISAAVLLLLNPGQIDLSALAGYFRHETVSVTDPAREAFYSAVSSASALLALALVFTFAFRRHRKSFEAAIAGALSHIWVELKLLLVGAAIFLVFLLAAEEFSFRPILTCSACLSVLAMILYFLCLDIGHNKRFFGHNIIHSVLIKLNDYHAMTTFQQKSLRRIYSCIGVIVGVIALASLIVLWSLDSDFHFSVATTIGTTLFALVGVFGTIWWYILAMKQDLRDWNALMTQITEMYGGNLDAVNLVPPTSNLYDCAMQLNMIRTGIQQAVKEGVKADHTKVELITNVSHDIKTPLTSIIGYVELLKKEPGLPDHVMDYINTISNKADRLSHIVQDVFDVSKAATGNIHLDLENLDIGKLLQQTFGEMEEVIRSSQLTWRVDIPDEPVIVHADGQRLYRVFQNLIRNCAQYSLEGSRAYVKLSAQNGTALVSIRNISKNEITMDGDDLTARFVRGDETRTTEGSGLGLSIAKSFTEACGGRFAVHTDGDLFTVAVRFPVVQQETEPTMEKPT